MQPKGPAGVAPCLELPRPAACANTHQLYFVRAAPRGAGGAWTGRLLCRYRGLGLDVIGVGSAYPGGLDS